MRIASLLLTILLMVGCGAKAKPVAFIPPPPLPLSVYLYPRIPIANTEVWVKCQLPTDVGEGNYVFGVVDMFQSMGAIEKIQHERLIRIPCYNIKAYCGYQEYKPNVGWQKPNKVEINIEPVGDCGK